MREWVGWIRPSITLLLCKNLLRLTLLCTNKNTQHCITLTFSMWSLWRIWSHRVCLVKLRFSAFTHTRTKSHTHIQRGKSLLQFSFKELIDSSRGHFRAQGCHNSILYSICHGHCNGLTTHPGCILPFTQCVLGKDPSPVTLNSNKRV